MLHKRQVWNCSPSDLLDTCPLTRAVLAHRCPFCPSSHSQSSPHFHSIAQLSFQRPHKEMGECLDLLSNPHKEKTLTCPESPLGTERIYINSTDQDGSSYCGKSYKFFPWSPCYSTDGCFQRSLRFLHRGAGKRQESTVKCSRNSHTTGWKARPLKITPVPCKWTYIQHIYAGRLTSLFPKYAGQAGFGESEANAACL